MNVQNIAKSQILIWVKYKTNIVARHVIIVRWPVREAGPLLGKPKPKLNERPGEPQLIILDDPKILRIFSVKRTNFQRVKDWLRYKFRRKKHVEVFRRAKADIVYEVDITD